MKRPQPVRPFEPPRRQLPSWTQIRPLRPPGHKDMGRAPGPNVTICIAARADNNCFVAVSDQRLFYSSAMAPADRATSKVASIAPTWHVLYSGDVGLAVQIIDDARRRLYPHKDN